MALDTQLITPEQKASELLLPADDGRFRSVSSLKKAFATTAQLTGLNKKFTPGACAGPSSRRGLAPRRTRRIFVDRTRNLFGRAAEGVT